MDVVSKRCRHSGCTKQPSFGVRPGEKPVFCHDHSAQGMVDVKNRRCCHEGCTRAPSYGVEASKKPEFCREHSKEGMVDVRSRRCGRSGCTKVPSYGAGARKRREYCSEHAMPGMVNVKSRRCRHRGCTTQPSYGAKGSTSRDYCLAHAKHGMGNTVSRRCGQRVCRKIPSYGREGSSKRDFCREHSKEGMVYFNARRCGQSGCDKLASFGVRKAEKGKYCSEHSQEGIACARPSTRSRERGVCDQSAIDFEGRKRRSLLVWREGSTVDLTVPCLTTDGKRARRSARSGRTGCFSGDVTKRSKRVRDVAEPFMAATPADGAVGGPTTSTESQASEPDAAVKTDARVAILCKVEPTQAEGKARRSARSCKEMFRTWRTHRRIDQLFWLRCVTLSRYRGPSSTFVLLQL